MSFSPSYFHTMAALTYMLVIIAELLEGTARLVRFFATIADATADADRGHAAAQSDESGGSPGSASHHGCLRPNCRRRREAAPQGGQGSGGTSQGHDNGQGHSGHSSAGQEHLCPGVSGKDLCGLSTCKSSMAEPESLLSRFATAARIDAKSGCFHRASTWRGLNHKSTGDGLRTTEIVMRSEGDCLNAGLTPFGLCLPHTATHQSASAPQ